MRILVTAVTHGAIDNLLLKIKSLMQRAAEDFRTIPYKFATPGSISVGSIVNEKRSDGRQARTGLRVVRLLLATKQVEVVDDANAPTRFFILASKDVQVALDLSPLNTYAKNPGATAPLRDACVVVGSTTQQLPRMEQQLIDHGAMVNGRKLSAADPSYFDLVVDDEASQMLLSQLAMPVHLLRRDGMLIIAGDHKQMVRAPLPSGDEHAYPRPSALLVHSPCLSSTLKPLIWPLLLPSRPATAADPSEYVAGCTARG